MQMLQSELLFKIFFTNTEVKSILKYEAINYIFTLFLDLKN